MAAILAFWIAVACPSVYGRNQLAETRRVILEYQLTNGKAGVAAPNIKENRNYILCQLVCDTLEETSVCTYLISIEFWIHLGMFVCPSTHFFVPLVCDKHSLGRINEGIDFNFGEYLGTS